MKATFRPLLATAFLFFLALPSSAFAFSALDEARGMVQRREGVPAVAGDPAETERGNRYVRRFFRMEDGSSCVITSVLDELDNEEFEFDAHCW